MSDEGVVLDQIPEFLLRSDRSVSIPDLHAKAESFRSVPNFDQLTCRVDIHIAVRKRIDNTACKVIFTCVLQIDEEIAVEIGKAH